MKRTAVYIFTIFIIILMTSCFSLRRAEASIEEVSVLDAEEPTEDIPSETEAVYEASEGIETEPVVTDQGVDLPIIEETDIVEESVPTSQFVEITEEEKKELEERVEDADVFKYSYKPADPVNNDSAKIGNVDIPKWFAYLCSGIIVAILIALCYISNQSKKKMYYYGRRE